MVKKTKKKKKKVQPPVERDIVPLVDLIPHAFRDEVPDFRLSTFWPSSASIQLEEGELIGSPSACLRCQFWRNIGQPKSNFPSDQAICNMENGTAIGIHLVEAIKRLGIYAGDERRIYIPEYNVSGRVDILVYDNVGDVIPVEVKTVWGYHGKKGTITDTRDKPFGPKLEHVLQLWLYLDFYFRIDQGIKPTGMNVPRIEATFPYGLLYYQARDNGERGQHVLKIVDTGETFEVRPGLEWPLTKMSINGKVWEEATNQMVYARWESLKRYIEMMMLPPRDWTIQYSQDELTEMAAQGKLNKAEMVKFAKDAFIEKGSFQCLSGLTYIIMANGQVKWARNVVEGDITDLGRVNKVHKNPADDRKMMMVKSLSAPAYYVTEDHEVCVWDKRDEAAIFVRADRALDYDHIVAHVDHEVEEVDITHDLAKFMGMMTGAWQQTRQDWPHHNVFHATIPRTLMMTVEGIMRKLFVDKASPYHGQATWKCKTKQDISNCISVTTLEVKGPILDMLSPTVPHQLMKASPDLQREYIENVFWIQSMASNTIVRTKNMSFAVKLQRMAWRCGVPMHMDMRYEARDPLALEYVLSVQPDMIKFEGYHVLLKLEEVLPIKYGGRFYDFEIEGSHMIPTIGGTVHNCGYCDFRDDCWAGISKTDLWEGVADKTTEVIDDE